MYKSAVMSLLPFRAQIFSRLVQTRGAAHLGLRFHATKPPGSVESAETAKPTESTEPSKTSPPIKTTGPVEDVETRSNRPGIASHENLQGVQDVPGVHSDAASGSRKSKDLREAFRRVPGDIKEDLTFLKANVNGGMAYLWAQFHDWRVRKFSKVPEQNICFLDSAYTQLIISIADCSNASQLRTVLSRSHVEAENEKCILKIEKSSCQIRDFIQHFDEHMPCELHRNLHGLYKNRSGLYESRSSGHCFTCVKLHSMYEIIASRARVTVAKRFLGVCNDDVGDIVKKAGASATDSTDTKKVYDKVLWELMKNELV